MIKGMFAPAAVPERFDREFPKELMLRPLQLRASAEDARHDDTRQPWSFRNTTAS